MKTTLSMPSTISSAVRVSEGDPGLGVRDPFHGRSTIMDVEEIAVPYAEPTVAGFTYHDADSHVMETPGVPDELRGSGGARAHEAALRHGRAARRSGHDRGAAQAAPRPRVPRARRGRDHAAQELDGDGLVPEGGSPARARPARLPQPARLQHLREQAPVRGRARRRRRARLRRRARAQPRDGRLLLGRPAPARDRLRAAARLRQGARDRRGGARARLQGAACSRPPARAVTRRVTSRSIRSGRWPRRRARRSCCTSAAAGSCSTRTTS